MIGNIKSKYFMQIIFSLLDEKAKLKIVKYNKNLQKQLDIETINYFVFTKKYIEMKKMEFQKSIFIIHILKINLMIL